MRDPKILVVANNKGGVAKTFTSNMIASVLERRNYKILLIDMDAQCSLSCIYLEMNKGIDGPETHSPPPHPEDNVPYASSVLYKTKCTWAPYPTTSKNIDFLPAISNHVGMDENEGFKVLSKRLHTQLRNPAIWDVYDIIIIDTGPAKEEYGKPATACAISSATHVIIPSGMEESQILGLFGLTQMIDQYNAPRPEDKLIKLIGILPTRVSNKAMHKRVLSNLKRSAAMKGLILPLVIKDRSIYLDKENAKITKSFNISSAKDNLPAIKEMNELADLIIKEVGLEPKVEEKNDI